MVSLAFVLFVALIIYLKITGFDSLQEWNSTEVFWTTYQNRSGPIPLTPPPWLKLFRAKSFPAGRRTHRHGYFDADGIHHMVTFANYVVGSPYRYYIAKWEPILFDVPQRRWIGGRFATPTWRPKEDKYYFINRTAQSNSVFVSKDGQGEMYKTWIKDYRSDWMYNDTMIFAYVNDTAKFIKGPFMVRKQKQRGSYFGKFDVYKLPPSRAYWHGLRRNRGRRLHEVFLK